MYFPVSKPSNPILVLLVLASCSVLHISWASAADLVIENTTLISPERPEPLQHATVLIKNGKIEKVFDHPITPTDDVQIVDGSKLFLVPGLMDSHLHTLVIPGLGFQGGERARTFARMTALYENQFERSLLYSGVTHFVDPVAHSAALERSRNRELSPDVFYCGAAPLARGYPMMFMDDAAIEATLPYRIYEETTAETLPKDLDLSQHTPEAVVARMRDDGAICLKLFFEDGWDMDSSWPMLSSDSIQRVIHAAHAADLKVVGHANALDMQQLAVKSGVDVIGHGLWNWNQYRKHEGVPEEIRHHLDAIREANIGYQPTLRVMDSMRELFMPAELNKPGVRKVVPAALLEWYRTPAAQAFKQELAREDFDQLPDETIIKLLQNPIDRGERSLRYLAENGHRLLLASDHPSTPGHANHPGLSTYQELVHMAAVGVSLKAIFEAATINNAETFGLADRYGTIETGKIANLLVLESNPLKSVEAYDRIRWVILGGRVIDRESLAAH